MRTVARIITYPKFFFTWPLIVAPAICEGLLYLGAGQKTAGWAYIITAMLVLLTLGIDLDRLSAFIGMIILTTGFLSSKVLFYERNIAVTQLLRDFIDALKVSYSPHIALAISILTCACYIWIFFWSHIHHRWEVTPTEFRHYSWGHIDKSLGRGAKSVRISYPDVLEFLLGFCGTLHIYDANGDKELIAIQHVPLLPLVYKRVDEVLSYKEPEKPAKTEEETSKEKKK